MRLRHQGETFWSIKKRLKSLLPGAPKGLKRSPGLGGLTTRGQRSLARVTPVPVMER